ncbi:uncharacterized protein LOC127242830 isoform X2 [Andrographis paniculata]|uniref:uncharacterized protein LOC127242830 isoform X2 n=2 Tax=Andrographis paniculata TaxID=175694 RepID=UPI0021E6EEDB|nr:uncharacterized protein LOC127242830 isoform X2 [Andrographis paniculata]
MWRWRKAASTFENKAQEDHDSDQSISEEDEGGDCAGSAISLCRAGDKGGMQVLSQLEMLRDSHELHPTEGEFIPSQEKKGVCLADDDIENPLFFSGDSSNHSSKISPAARNHINKETACLPTVASLSHTNEEIISDDEIEEISSPILKSAREDIGSTWSEATREAEALNCLHKNSFHSSLHGALVKERNLYKSGGGDRTKSKAKFIFRSHSRTEDACLVVTDRDGNTSSKNITETNNIGAAAADAVGHFFNESKLITLAKESKQTAEDIVPSETAYKHEVREHVAEYLDCVNERNDLQGSLKQGINKRKWRAQMALNRNESLLGDRNREDVSDSSPSCSDDEENPKSVKPILRRRAMVDQFCDAFGMSSAIDERPYMAFPGSSGGVHQKLQQVMKIAKDTDMDYLKYTSASSCSKDERAWIHVRILSRSLEAKLIVCSCAAVEDSKKSHEENNFEMRMKDGAAAALTVIFNPRVCSDVELEVGNLICIHHPWKEMRVKGKDEPILLCSYFSPIKT